MYFIVFTILLTMFQQDFLKQGKEGGRLPHHNNVTRCDRLNPIIVPKYVFIEYTL